MIGAKYEERTDDLLEQAERMHEALGNEDFNRWERWTEDFDAQERPDIAPLFDRTDLAVLYQETVDTPCDVEGEDVPEVEPEMTIAQAVCVKQQSDMLSSMQQATYLRYQTRIFTIGSAKSLRKGLMVRVFPLWYKEYIESFVDVKARAGEYYT